MRITINNLLTVDNTTVPGESPGFPSSNMLSNEFVLKTLIGSSIDIDLGSSKQAKSCSLFNNSQNFTIKGGTAPGTWLFTASISNNLIFFDETYRYWIIENDEISAYELLDDNNLDTPDATYDTASQLVDFVDDSSTMTISLGGLEWDHTSGAPGSSYVLSGQGGSGGGELSFKVESGTQWQTFNAGSGLRTFNLPKSANGDTLGGSFTYYYDNAAYVAAFSGNSDDIVVSRDGSVYKGSISSANLVVNSSGVVGDAGGGTTEALSSFINYISLGDFLQLPSYETGPVIIPIAREIKNETASGQIYTTPGVAINNLDLDIGGTSYQIWQDFDTWFRSDDRFNNFILAQYEDDLIKVPPFLATIPVDGYSGLQRESNAATYQFSLQFREAK